MNSEQQTYEYVHEIVEACTDFYCILTVHPLLLRAIGGYPLISPWSRFSVMGTYYQFVYPSNIVSGLPASVYRAKQIENGAWLATTVLSAVLLGNWVAQTVSVALQASTSLWYLEGMANGLLLCMSITRAIRTFAQAYIAWKNDKASSAWIELLGWGCYFILFGLCIVGLVACTNWGWLAPPVLTAIGNCLNTVPIVFEYVLKQGSQLKKMCCSLAGRLVAGEVSSQSTAVSATIQWGDTAMHVARCGASVILTYWFIALPQVPVPFFSVLSLVYLAYIVYIATQHRPAVASTVASNGPATELAG